MADVIHEEAYLSCLSSDCDEYADLLTDAEDLAYTDSEGSVQHLGIKPYQYEPYLSDAGQGKTEAAKAMTLGPTRTTKALKGFVITNGWLPSIARYAYKFIRLCLYIYVHTYRSSTGARVEGNALRCPLLGKVFAALKDQKSRTRCQNCKHLTL